MKIFRKLQELREANAAAAETSRRALEQASRLTSEAEHRQAIAVENLYHATKQAERLSGADRRNHYSESLTHAFRGNPA